MTTRVKLFVAAMLVAAGWCAWMSASFPSHDWIRFAVYLTAILLSSSLKVAMPGGDRTMSVNFPFILLGIVQLSPIQAIALGAISVFAQCRIKVLKPFTLMQIVFNVANVTTSTTVAWFCFAFLVKHHVELAPALAIAATSYFFANTIAIAFVVGWSSEEAPAALWRREFPWYLPFYLVGAALAAVAHLISLRYGLTTSLLLIPVVYTIYRAYRTQIKAVQDRQVHLEETEALHFRTIEGLAMAIEAKDHNTHEHLLRVRVYVSEIGKSMGLSESETQALLTAALLHDIGKLAVPEHIINKPGKLTPEEFDKMKIHPVVGAEILERVRFPYPVVPIVRSHHEAWDGSGYPDGLVGEQIPLGARILTVVDCFDALASDRPYRKALPLDKAMELVKSKAGSQFDPQVVAILEKRFIELEALASHTQDGLAPLNTEITVWRGAAPGAGFQESNGGATAPSEGDVGSTAEGGPFTPVESLNLIAAAGQEAQALFEMSEVLGNALSPDEMISMMSSRLHRLVAFDCFAVYLKDNESLSACHMDGDGAHCFSDVRIPLGEGLSGWVANCGKAILNGNPKVEPNYAVGAASAIQMNSALSLPLREPNGEIFGALTIYSAAVNAFNRDHLRMLEAIEAKFSLSLRNVLHSHTEEKDEKIDFVTKLPNIREFFLDVDEELTGARRSKDTLGIVVWDLGFVKEVSDTRGRRTADLLLRSIANGFRECCRSTDIVARSGGEEFVFLLTDVDAVTCTVPLDVLKRSLRKACADFDIDMDLSTSLGTAFYPADGEAAEELLGLAYRRMYLQKSMHHAVIPDTYQKTPTPMAAVA